MHLNVELIDWFENACCHVWPWLVHVVQLQSRKSLLTSKKRLLVCRSMFWLRLNYKDGATRLGNLYVDWLQLCRRKQSSIRFGILLSKFVSIVLNAIGSHLSIQFGWRAPRDAWKFLGGAWSRLLYLFTFQFLPHVLCLCVPAFTYIVFFVFYFFLQGWIQSAMVSFHQQFQSRKLSFQVLKVEWWCKSDKRLKCEVFSCSGSDHSDLLNYVRYWT